MRSSRQSVATPGDGCRSGGSRRAVPDGGRRRRTFTLQERVALARRIWHVKGYETTARRRDGDTYVLARSDDGTTELVRIAGEQPSSEATLGSIESLRAAYGFDTAYYFDPDRSLQPLETDVKVLDRKRIGRIVSQYDLPDTVPEPSSTAEAAAQPEGTPDSTRTTDDPGDDTVFEVHSPISDPDRYLYVVGSVLITLAVSGLPLWLVALVAPVDGVLPLGLLLATGLSVWVGYRMYRHVAAIRRGAPVLRIDARGIHVRRWWTSRSIPWDRIAGVHLERRSVSVRERVLEFHWLGIDVAEFGDETSTSYLHRLHSSITNALLGTSGTVHRLRIDRYDVDFEAVARTIERYAEVPVERRDR